MYKVQQNAEGKLRLLQEGQDPIRLMATLDELHADPNWRDRIEFRQSQYDENKQYAILEASPYEDIDV